MPYGCGFIGMHAAFSIRRFADLPWFEVLHICLCHHTRYSSFTIIALST